MALFTAVADITLSESIFGYGSSLITNATTFEYSNVGATFNVNMAATLGDPFTYNAGSRPDGGTVTGLTIENGGGTPLMNVTGLSLAASPLLSGVFSGSSVVGTVFAGNDELNGGTHVVNLFGDFDVLQNALLTIFANDDMADGVGAASGVLTGDVNQIGNGGISGGTVSAGNDNLFMRSNDSTAYGDVWNLANGILFGGNDTIQGISGIGTANAYGDGGILGSGQLAYGGNDNIVFDNAGGFGNHTLVGDFNAVHGTLVGGDDQIGATIFDAPVEVVVGDAFSVSFSGTAIGGNDQLRGNTLGDVMGDVFQNSGSVTGGDDTFNATVGNDTYIGDVKLNNSLGNVVGGDDILNGADGNDLLIGDISENNGVLIRGGHDRLDGGNGDDQLFGDIFNTGVGSVRQGGNDTLLGGAGNDTLTGGAGNDLLNGGADIDTASFLDAPQGVTVRLLSNAANGHGVDTLNDIENIRGSNFADDIVGDLGANRLRGEGGNDILNGAAGNDQLEGGDQDDMMNGGNGDDIMDGGEGNDTLIGGFGADFMNGNNGTDTYRVGQPGGAVNVNLLTGSATGAAGNDTFASVENITGGNGTDTYIGSNAINRITGANGNDTIVGNGGADELFGQNGNDTLNGGTGNDMLNGGMGNDLFIATNGTGHDMVIGWSGGAGSSDRIDVQAFAGITDFTDLMNNHLNQNGANLEIMLDVDDMLILNGRTSADIAADDFIFA